MWHSGLSGLSIWYTVLGRKQLRAEPISGPEKCKDIFLKKSCYKPRYTIDKISYPVQGGSPVGGGAVGAVERVEALPERGMIDGRVQNLQRKRVAPAVLSVVQLRPPETPAVIDGSVDTVTVGVGVMQGRVRGRGGIRRQT